MCSVKTIKKKKSLSALKNKTRGDSTLVATLLAVFVIAILSVSLLYAYGQVVKQNKIERIQRKYILSMEKEGYLTPAKKAELLTELGNAGLSGIDLGGTTTSSVAYGGQVVLRIRGTLKVDRMKFTGGNAQKGDAYVTIDITKTGTALH